MAYLGRTRALINFHSLGRSAAQLLGGIRHSFMEQEKLLKIIARLLNIKEVDKVKAMIEAEDGEDAVTTLSGAILKAKFEEGLKKGIGKSLKDLVSTFANEFDFDVTGSTIEEITASVKSGFENRDGSDISEDQVKASDTYKKLQSELTRAEQNQNKIVEKKVKEALTVKENEFKEGIKKAKRQAIDSELEVEAEKWLVDNKALLSEDKVKRRKQIKELAAKLANDEIEKDEDDNFLISKDGAPITNKLGHNATLADRFSEYDYMFHFQEVQQRQSSGLPPGGVQGGGNAQFKHFKGEVPKDDVGMNKIRMEYNENKISRDEYKEVEIAYNAAQTK